jgi:hypothetical protein
MISDMRILISDFGLERGAGFARTERAEPFGRELRAERRAPIRPIRNQISEIRNLSAVALAKADHKS